MSQELLAHRLEGKGAPVLLLNGGLMTFASWEPLASKLRQDHQLVRCDFRGQLMSPGEAHRDLAGNVDDLIALLDHLGLERVHAIGTSFGGEIALLLAADHPERLRSLIAITVTDHATAETQQNSWALRNVVDEIRQGGDTGKLHDLLVEGVYSRDFVNANQEGLAARREQIASLPHVWFEGLEGILESVHDLDLRPCLSEIRCPTLIVTATDDRLLIPERGRAVASAIRGAELAEHPTAGHGLVVEDPEWLVDRCLDFIAKF